MNFFETLLFFKSALSWFRLFIGNKIHSFIFAHAYRQNNYKPVVTVVRGSFSQTLFFTGNFTLSVSR